MGGLRTGALLLWITVSCTGDSTRPAGVASTGPAHVTQPAAVEQSTAVAPQPSRQPASSTVRVEVASWRAEPFPDAASARVFASTQGVELGVPTPDLAGTWMLKAPLSSDMQTTVTRTTTEVPNVLTAVVRSVASDGSFELVSVRFEVWGYQQVCVVASTMQVLAREGVTGPDLKRPTDGCVPARASRDRVAIANSLQLRQVP